MADDDTDTPAPPAKRQRVEPEAASPPVDDATQSMDLTADDDNPVWPTTDPAVTLTDARALTDDERALLSARLALIEQDPSDPRLEMPLVRLTMTAGVEHAASRFAETWSRGALAPPGWSVRLWCRIDHTEALFYAIMRPTLFHNKVCSRIERPLDDWCQQYGQGRLDTAASAHTEFGKLGADPDVFVLPTGDNTTTDYRPRFVVEVEHRHRSIPKLRQRVYEYFADDPNNDTRAVLAMELEHNGNAQPPKRNAQAVLYERDAAGVPRVTVAMDFGGQEVTPGQVRRWRAFAADQAPPVDFSNRQHRRDPGNKAWPDVPGVWAPGARPLVPVPVADLVHNVVNAAVIVAALPSNADPVHIDLAAALEVAVRQAKRTGSEHLA